MSSNIGWKKKIFLKYKTKTKAIIITYANCDLKTFSDKIDKDFQKSLGNNCYIEINGKVIDTGRTLEDVLRAANTTALDCIVKDGQIPNPKSYNITINFEKNMTETPFQYELPISDTSDTIQWEKNYKELQKKIGNKLKNQYWESKYLLLDKANVNIDNGYDLAVAFDELNDLDAKGASPLVITFVVTKMKVEHDEEEEKKEKAQEVTVVNLKALLAENEHLEHYNKIREYCYFKNKSYEEGLKDMVAIIRHVNDPKAKLNSQNNSVGLQNPLHLSDTEKCFSFGIGPLTIDFLVNYDLTEKTGSIRVKASVIGITLVDAPVASIENGKASASISPTVGIAGITLTCTFGIDDEKYFIEFTISGYAGIEPFKAEFGPDTKRFDLPF